MDRQYFYVLFTSDVHIAPTAGTANPRFSADSDQELIAGAPKLQIPVHRGQSFRRIADSIPVIADSF